MKKLEQIAEYKSCLTCVHRRPYPASMKNGQPEYRCFHCGMAPDTGKETVMPEDSCDYWDKVTLDNE